MSDSTFVICAANGILLAGIENNISKLDVRGQLNDYKSQILPSPVHSRASPGIFFSFATTFAILKKLSPFWKSWSHFGAKLIQIISHLLIVTYYFVSLQTYLTKWFMQQMCLENM